MLYFKKAFIFSDEDWILEITRSVYVYESVSPEVLLMQNAGRGCFYTVFLLHGCKSFMR